MEQGYIIVSIIVLIVILGALYFVLKKKKGRKELSFLTKIAFVFIFAGMASSAVFDLDRLIGYGLMGVGVLFAIADIIKNSLNKGTEDNPDSNQQ